MRGLWPTLTAAIVVDGLHLRHRVEAVDVLEPAEAPVAPDHRFLTAAGVVVDDATARAASAHARAHGLAVLDLVPVDLPVERVLDMARVFDAETFRDNPLAVGHGALHAILVTDDVVERARIDVLDGLSPSTMADLTMKLKSYAPRSMDVVRAPSLHAAPEAPGARIDHLTKVFGGPVTVGGLTGDLALLGTAAVKRRPWALAAVAARVAQPLVAVPGTAARPRDMATAVPRRLVSAFRDLPRALFRRREHPPEEDPEQLREDYDKLLAGGIDRFFEPRRPDCPVCASAALTVRVRCRDHIQCKPGTFTLEECGGCGHIFQNPRLTPEGLDFYYRDFYDGASERLLEGVFGRVPALYRSRAEMVEGFATPRRWLDVGGGHGHFCLTARTTWPDTAFDVVDIGETIEESARRGWVDSSYRGMFPDLAGEMRGRYDVVSMSHYLEHTRDQRVEIDAAAEALEPGGLLMIEVPDPDSRVSHVLGRYWFPWFQPQHQHFLSIENLKSLLAERGFTAVAEERGSVHIGVDFMSAAGLFTNRLSPRLNVPWRPRPTTAERVRRGAAIVVGSPLVIAGTAVDLALKPLGGRFRTSNTYRVLARRDGTPAATSS